MKDDIPGVREARYRLLGLQAVPHADGIIVRRGTSRIFVAGEGVGELLDLLIERSASGNGFALTELKSELPIARHGVLIGLVEKLRGERLLLAIEESVPDLPGSERREEIFFWNRDASFATEADKLARIELAVFGVNHIALSLLGNLRSCGFRAVTLVDHPAIRNLDFFTKKQEIRPEIAGALSTPPRPLDVWQNSGAAPACHIVCSDFGGLALMRDWNRTCVERNALFYPIVLQDEIAYLGPLVVPREGPCFECLWARQNANLEDPARERATEAHAFFGQGVTGYLQPMARIAADIAAIELLKYFSRALPGGRAGRLIEVDLMRPAITSRNVLKVPRCPVCARRPLPLQAGPRLIKAPGEEIL